MTHRRVLEMTFVAESVPKQAASRPMHPILNGRKAAIRAGELSRYTQT